jgi:hypothetical protein
MAGTLSPPQIITWEMPMGMNRWRAALLLSLLGGFTVPAATWAQAGFFLTPAVSLGEVEEEEEFLPTRPGLRREEDVLRRLSPGFYVIPSLSIAEVYDDNIFSTPSGRVREQDIITRISPGIQAGYRSVPLTLLGRYSFDAEIFPDHSDLTDAQARQRAGIEFRYLPTRLLTLAFTGEYVETQTPGELNLVTGIEGGRVRAQSYTVQPSVAYQFNPLTKGAGSYQFETIESGGVTSDVHTTTLGLDRRLTPRDTGSLGYIFRHFSFDSNDTTTSHTVTLGWLRQLTRQTSILLRAGPRFSEEDVDAEVLASIRHRLKQGELSFTYERSQDTVAGETGSVDTDTLSAGLTYQLLRFLEVSAVPSFSRITRGSAEAEVYRAGLHLTYQLTKWLSLLGSYQFSLQQGRLEAAAIAAGRGDEEIYHNIILLGLTFTSPYRLY